MKALAQIFRYHRKLVVVATLAVAAVAVAAGSLLPVTWKARSTLFVSSFNVQRDLGPVAPLDGFQYDRLVSTKLVFLGSEAVLGPAARSLGEELTEEFGEAFEAERKPGTQFVRLVASGSTFDEAVQRNRAVTDAFVAIETRSAIAAIDAQLAEYDTQIAEVAAQADGLQRQIDEVQAANPTIAVDSAVAGRLASLRGQLADAQRRIADLGSQKSQLAAQRDQAVQPVRVVEAAQSAWSEGVGRPLLAALGLVLGLALGFLLAAVVDQLRPLVRTEDDVNDAAPGATVVAELPKVLRRTSLERPTDQVETSVARLAGRLMLELRDRDSAVIAVSGPNGDERSTVVAALLANALANAGRETVLVLGDVTAAAERSVWGVSSGDAGLVEMMFNSRPAEEVVVGTEKPELWVLPTGERKVADGTVHPEMVDRALDQLRSEGMWTVVDAPSVLNSVSGPLFAAAADVTLLLVDAKRTDPASLDDAYELLTRVKHERELAVVLAAA